MTSDVTDSQYDVSLTHFTGSFILSDKNTIQCKFYVHDVAFKVQTKLNILRFGEGMSGVYINSRG